MWYLHRITHWNECMKCDASGEIMMNGEFYYENPETGKRVSAKYWKGLKDEYRTKHWDQSMLKQAKTEKDYQEQLKKAEQDYISATIVGEPFYGKPSENAAGHIPVNGR